MKLTKLKSRLFVLNLIILDLIFKYGNQGIRVGPLSSNVNDIQKLYVFNINAISTQLKYEKFF